MKWLAAALPAVLLAVVIPMTAAPERMSVALQRILRPSSDLLPYAKTRIVSLQPQDARVQRGAELTVTAVLEGDIPSETVIYDSRTGEKVWQLHTPENEGNVIPGRNPSHVDNHPVFSRDGKSVFLNRMRDGNAELVRIGLPTEVLAR